MKGCAREEKHAAHCLFSDNVLFETLNFKLSFSFVILKKQNNDSVFAKADCQPSGTLTAFRITYAEKSEAVCFFWTMPVWNSPDICLKSEIHRQDFCTNPFLFIITARLEISKYFCLFCHNNQWLRLFPTCLRSAGALMYVYVCVSIEWAIWTSFIYIERPLGCLSLPSRLGRLQTKTAS